MNASYRLVLSQTWKAGGLVAFGPVTASLSAKRLTAVRMLLGSVRAVAACHSRQDRSREEVAFPLSG